MFEICHTAGVLKSIMELFAFAPQKLGLVILVVTRYEGHRAELKLGTEAILLSFISV